MLKFAIFSGCVALVVAVWGLTPTQPARTRGGPDFGQDPPSRRVMDAWTLLSRSW